LVFSLLNYQDDARSHKHKMNMNIGDRGNTAVKVLCYKSEGRCFDPSWCKWIFRWHKILPIAPWPWGHSASNRNEYQEYFLGVKAADNLPPSCAVVTKSGNLNFLEPSGPLRACNGTDKKYEYCYIGMWRLGSKDGGDIVPKRRKIWIWRQQVFTKFRSLSPKLHVVIL